MIWGEVYYMKNVVKPNKKLSLQEIEEFEIQYNITLPEKYKKFLLQSNGGKPEMNVFFISKDQGSSLVRGLFGLYIGGYKDLVQNIEIYDGRLPKGFLPIGDDPGGNLLCVGTDEKYYDNIYFWDHEEEVTERDYSKNGLINMYFLAKDIYDFLDKLHDEV